MAKGVALVVSANQISKTLRSCSPYFTVAKSGSGSLLFYAQVKITAVNSNINVLIVLINICFMICIFKV